MVFDKVLMHLQFYHIYNIDVLYYHIDMKNISIDLHLHQHHNISKKKKNKIVTQN